MSILLASRFGMLPLFKCPLCIHCLSVFGRVRFHFNRNEKKPYLSVKEIFEMKITITFLQCQPSIIPVKILILLQLHFLFLFDAAVLEGLF